MEFDVNISTPMEKCQLEEKNEMLHRTITYLSLLKSNLWCSNFREEGHKKDKCKHQIFQIIQIEHFCEISWEINAHLTKYFPYNLKNQKKCLCAICEESSHNTNNCELNVKIHQVVYKTEVIPNDQALTNNYSDNGYNQCGGYSGQGWPSGRGSFSGQGWYGNKSGRIYKC